MKHVLKIATAALLAASLAACASPGTAGAPAPAQAQAQAQAAWYVYCASYNAMQPAIIAKIPTTSPGTLRAVQPLLDSIARECSGPMPTNANAAAAQLSSDVTTVVITLGLQQALAKTQPQPTKATK